MVQENDIQEVCELMREEDWREFEKEGRELLESYWER